MYGGVRSDLRDKKEPPQGTKAHLSGDIHDEVMDSCLFTDGTGLTLIITYYEQKINTLA